MSRSGDLSRRRRLAGGVRGKWYAYWRSVRLAERVFRAPVAARPFSFTPLDTQQPGLVLFIRPPEELELRYEGVKRHVPPPAGAIFGVPAGNPAWVRSSGCKDALHINLEPGLVARVAAEAFGLDPARLTVPPLDGLDLPHLRAAMGAVDAELTAGGAGGRLAAESLANVLAVHPLRHLLAPRRPERGPDGTLPRAKLRAGLSDQSQFSQHFKRLVGVTPGQFRTPARIA
jgi:hypothetical protein